MLILAHAVVPHHHHNKVFVAIVNILNHDAQDIFNHEHDHEHHHEGNSEDCIKGFGSGFGALAIAFAVGEQLPNWPYNFIAITQQISAPDLSVHWLFALSWQWKRMWYLPHDHAEPLRYNLMLSRGFQEHSPHLVHSL